MSFESIALVAAWAIILLIVLGGIVPRLMPLRADDGELLYEDDFFDVGGPVIDAEPA